MTAPKKNPKLTWERVPNAVPGKGNRPKNKYNFTQVLKRVGDFVETHEFSNKTEAYKVVYAAHIWAFRHKYRVKTWFIYLPEGIAVGIERIQ